MSAAVESRVGVIAILVKGAEPEAVSLLNQYLGEFGEIVIGRMGIPYRERQLKVISIIVDGTTDQIGALTGKLGNLPGITTRATLLTK